MRRPWLRSLAAAALLAGALVLVFGVLRVVGPWQTSAGPVAVIVIPSVTPAGDYYNGLVCSGTIVHEVVVTAAHCVERFRDRRLDVVVGVDDLCHPDGSERRLGVRESVVHPGYSGDGPYDIAILITNDELGEVAPGPPTIVVGFGSHQLGGSPGCEPTVSQAQVLADEDCRSLLSGVVGRHFDVASNTCAHLYPDQCQWSSGAPLSGSSEGAVVGIMSWGAGCGEGLPAVFADLEELDGWISEIASAAVAVHPPIGRSGPDRPNVPGASL